MHQTMKALRLHSPHMLKMSQEPVPAAGQGELLLRMRAVGICASDVHYYNEGGIGDISITEPLVLGHEVGAEVVAVGQGVENFAPGDIVAVEPQNNCQKCPQCEKGLVNLCPDVRFFGTPPQDGALREFAAWPARLCLKMPEGTDAVDAAMTEPMAVGIYAADMAGIQGGESVAVLGAGAIGLSALQAAVAMGAKSVWVSDPIPERAALASRLGAAGVVSAPPEEAVAALRKGLGGGGADIVFECAGTSEAVDESCQIAGFDAQVIVAGIPFPDQICVTASVARRKNLSLKFVRRSRNATERAIEWAAAKKIDLSCYATHRFPLEDADTAMKMSLEKTDGIIRAVVEV